MTVQRVLERFEPTRFIIEIAQTVLHEDDESDALAHPGVLAWASLACWFGAILTGRLLAYTSTSKYESEGAARALARINDPSMSPIR